MDSRKFGRYEILGKLGRGAMGVVYKAFDPMLERDLAIKVMSSGTDEEAVKRFFREARATAGLRHPNIVAVYDIGEEDHQPYIAIEYLDGQDLGQFLNKDLFVPFVWKIRLIIDLCRGLHHAHQQGVIHRDIKPSNVRVTRSGEVKIVDFGVAKLKSSEMTATGMVVGTPSYMSPQQVQGVKELDGRSDIFSAGVLLFELIAGRKPFAAPELHAVMFQICNTPHPSLSEILPGCSEELSAIVDRALAKDIEDRFQTGEEMACALEEFLKQLDEACGSLQQDFDRKADQLRQQSKRLEKEGLADLVPSDLQQIPPPAVDPDQTILQDFGLFQAASQQRTDYGELLHRSAALSRQLEELDRARQDLKEVRQSYAQCREQFKSRQWKDCLASLEALLSKHPDFAPAVELKKACQARLEQEKLERELEARLDKLLKQARSARQSEKPQEAQKLAQALLELSPEHGEAAEISEWAEQALRLQADLEEHLAQARARSEEGDHQGCLEAARSGLEVAPGHPELSRLKEQSRQMLEKQSKAEELLSQARSQLEAGELEACLETVKKGLHSVPGHQALQQLEAQARSELKRTRQAAELFEKAQAEYQAGNHAQVLQTVQSLLDLDSSHQPAQQLLEQARQALEVQEQIETLIQQARSQLEGGNAQACLESLGQGLELDGENKQLKKLKQQAEAELERRRQADQAWTAARQQAQAGELQSALAHLERALELDPGRQEARQLEKELKAELGKRQTVAEGLGRARRQLDKGEFKAALRQIEQVLKLEDRNAEALQIQSQARQALDVQEQVELLIEQARSHLEAEDPESCLESLRQGLELDDGNDQLQELQQLAKAKLAKRRQADQALAAARKKAKAEDFQSALKHLERALQLTPGWQEARRLQEELKSELERQERLQGLLAAAQEQEDSGDLQEALANADEGLQIEPEHPVLRELQQRVQQSLQRQQEIQSLLDQAEQQLEEKDYSAALKSVESLAKLQSDHPRIEALQEAARQGLKEIERGQQLLAKARSQAGKGDFQACLQSALQGLEILPGHAPLQELREQAEQELDKRRSVAEGLGQARQLLDKGEFEAALRQIDQVLQLEEGNEEALKVQSQAQQSLKRQQQVEELASKARQHLDKGQPEEALKAARRGLEMHSGHSELSRLAEQSEEAIRRRKQVDDLLKKADAALKDKDIEAASGLAKRLEDLSPQQPEVQAVRERVQRQQAEGLLLKARRLEEEEELPAALEAAARALQLAPRHKELKQLHRRVQQRLDQIRQQEERESKIRKGLLAARLAFEKGRLRAAQGALAPVLKLAPDLEEAQELGQKVEVARQHRQAQLRQGGLGAAAALAVLLAGYLLWPNGTVDGPDPSTWISYQLRAGDTLQSAAARLGVDADQLISSNHLEGPENVFPGQVLQSSPPEDPGTLVLNISPWASVEALMRQDGTQVLEGTSLTPLRIDLAPGEYTVRASNPELGGEGMEFIVTIEAGQVKREFRKWPHVDLERELNRLFVSRSATAEGTN